MQQKEAPMPSNFDFRTTGWATQSRGAQPLAELQRLFKALEEVVESSVIDAWLTTPNAAFDSLKPLDVIERGEIDRIWQMTDQLRSGVAF